MRDRRRALGGGASLPVADRSRDRGRRLRRSARALAAEALAFALCLASPARAAPPESADPPALTISSRPAKGRPGALLAISVASPRPLASLRVSGPGAAARVEPDASRRKFRGVLAIDLEKAPGPLRLTFEGTEADGSAFSRSWTLPVASGKFAVESLKVDPALVEPPADVFPRIEKERERVAALWKESEDRRSWTAPFGKPVAVDPRDNFGVRRVFNGKERSRHGGVDFPAPSGTPVRAPAPGRVVLAEELYFSGGTVILDHGAGLFTSYFHLSRIDVRPGDRVGTGVALGAVGTTGRVTGPHLHWSARLEGARINPLSLRRLPEWPVASSP